MSKKEKEIRDEKLEEHDEELQEDAVETMDEDSGEKEYSKEDLEAHIKSLEEEVAELKDKNLRLYAEFDNYRRRSAREQIEFSKSAAQDVITELLPVLDDFDRARKSLEEGGDEASVQEGINLIYNKLFSMLKQKGLKPMDSVGKEFNSEIHEAISEIPTDKKKMKGKVIDEVEKGYYLNDKIIRYAKVVVGK